MDQWEAGLQILNPALRLPTTRVNAAVDKSYAASYRSLLDGLAYPAGEAFSMCSADVLPSTAAHETRVNLEAGEKFLKAPFWSKTL